LGEGLGVRAKSTLHTSIQQRRTIHYPPFTIHYF
jgi:hypothetical protein